jgi:Ran GTPase-activating protein (RanGAP) involved in mRNA processing and transport
MRDQVVWLHGLRGEKPDNIHGIGLKEFYLQFNKLGHEFTRAISKVIKYDEYLRVLDVRNNKISVESVKKDLLHALKSNQSLTNLDMRQNPCYNISIA